MLPGKWLVECEGLPSLNIARNMYRESDMQIGRNKNFLCAGKICWTVALEKYYEHKGNEWYIHVAMIVTCALLNFSRILPEDR